jgi:hypothetical protein
MTRSIRRESCAVKLAVAVGLGLVWLLVAGPFAAVFALVFCPAAAFAYDVVRHPPTESESSAPLFAAIRTVCVNPDLSRAARPVRHAMLGDSRHGQESDKRKERT